MILRNLCKMEHGLRGMMRRVINSRCQRVIVNSLQRRNSWMRRTVSSLTVMMSKEVVMMKMIVIAIRRRMRKIWMRRG